MKSLHKLTPLFRLIFATLVLAVAITLLYRGAFNSTSAQQCPKSDKSKIQFRSMSRST